MAKKRKEAMQRKKHSSSETDTGDKTAEEKKSEKCQSETCCKNKSLTCQKPLIKHRRGRRPLSTPVRQVEEMVAAELLSNSGQRTVWQAEQSQTRPCGFIASSTLQATWPDRAVKQSHSESPGVKSQQCRSMERSEGAFGSGSNSPEPKWKLPLGEGQKVASEYPIDLFSDGGS